MEPVELSTGGLLLRAWCADDVDAIYRACQDPQIPRWTPIPSPYTRADAEAAVTSCARGWADDTSAIFGVFDATTGELLGAEYLIRLDLKRRTGEIGYWTAPWARGRGVATEASRAVARWAFDVLGLARLAWQAEVGNHGSRAVAARLGVRIEGVQRRALSSGDRPADALADGWLGSLLPGELREAGAPISLADRLVIHRARAFAQPQPTLTTRTASGAEIRLRAPRPADHAAIIKACQDPESLRWTTLPNPYTAADADFFVQFTRAKWALGEGMVCAIVDADDAYCGSMELRLLPHPPMVGDVGYLVAPWARGRGYASAALRALCEWGFTTLAVQRVEWRAFIGNHASRRVAEKAGFTVEGTIRAGCPQHGVLRDDWIGSLLPADLGIEIPAELR